MNDNNIDIVKLKHAKKLSLYIDTELLLARRALKTLVMEEEYEGNVEATGEDFSIEPIDSKRPFRALLDVGLIRTTTGNGVFDALKGAFDGGLNFPSNEKKVCWI